MRFLRALASLLLFSTNYYNKSKRKNESEEITRHRKEGQIYIKKSANLKEKKAGAFTCTAGTKVKKPANKTVISVKIFFTIYQPSLLSPAK